MINTRGGERSRGKIITFAQRLASAHTTHSREWGRGSTDKRRTADFTPVTDFVQVSVFFGEKSVGGRR